MIGPPPALTLVLTCIVVLLTVVVHTNPCTTFNCRFCFHFRLHFCGSAVSVDAHSGAGFYAAFNFHVAGLLLLDLI